MAVLIMDKKKDCLEFLTRKAEDYIYRPFFDEEERIVLFTDGHFIATVSPVESVDCSELIEKFEPGYGKDARDFPTIAAKQIIEEANDVRNHQEPSMFDLRKVSEFVKNAFATDDESDSCPECLGEGTVQYEHYARSTGQTYYVIEDCPVCNGTCKKDNSEKYKYVKINGCHN